MKLKKNIQKKKKKKKNPDEPVSFSGLLSLMVSWCARVSLLIVVVEYL